MCVLVVALREHADYDLVVAANRDEFHDRPTAHAAPWTDQPTLLAGRDLEAGGTWLGVDQHGRFAAVTNWPDAVATSYERYVQNQLRERFGFDAVPVRISWRPKRRKGDEPTAP